MTGCQGLIYDVASDPAGATGGGINVDESPFSDPPFRENVGDLVG